MQEMKKITQHKRNLKIINNGGRILLPRSFFHIGEIVQHPTFEDPPTYKLENDQRYYVDMPQSPTVREQ
jgi:hypothetical protein